MPPSTISALAFWRGTKVAGEVGGPVGAHLFQEPDRVLRAAGLQRLLGELVGGLRVRLSAMCRLVVGAEFGVAALDDAAAGGEVLDHCLVDADDLTRWAAVAVRVGTVGKRGAKQAGELGFDRRVVGLRIRDPERV